MSSRKKSASSEAEEKPGSIAKAASESEVEDEESEEDLDFLVNLSAELQHGYRILCYLVQDHNVVWPFKEPVDVEGMQLLNYREIVERPICFKDSE